MLESLTELGGWLLREVVNSGSDGALVGKESRNSALVLGSGSANERGVVQKTVFGSVPLSLQCSEEGLLGTKNLNGRGGVLGKIG